MGRAFFFPSLYPPRISQISDSYCTYDYMAVLFPRLSSCEGLMDTKYYIDGRERIQKWLVEYRGNVQARFDTKEEAEEWRRLNFRGHGHDSERVQVRKNSPRGVKWEEWM
jgi:hypothetical protein